jgi:putative transposase
LNAIGTLCELFGKSRQAYYQQAKYNYKEVVKAEIILKLVHKHLKLMPRIGGRKLLYLLRERLPEDMTLGRDEFFDLLRDNHLLVKKRIYRVRTTYSNHWLHKYPNLVKDFIPDRAHRLWVSDITYLETSQGFIYLFLITDAYSRKIVGWSLGDTLEAKHAVTALRMALRQLPDHVTDIFHHSDRGVQYCSAEYVKILRKRKIKISMTENGDPLENAIAERVNGILKAEWINDLKLEDKQLAVKEIDKVIKIYNFSRPHGSINMMTPEKAHVQEGILKRHWKNNYRKVPGLVAEEKRL